MHLLLIPYLSYKLPYINIIWFIIYNVYVYMNARPPNVQIQELIVLPTN